MPPAFHPKKCISSKSGVSLIEVVYESKNAKVIIVPNLITEQTEQPTCIAKTVIKKYPPK